LTRMRKTISVAACEKSIGESKTFPGVADVQNCSFYRQIISEAESTTARPFRWARQVPWAVGEYVCERKACLRKAPFPESRRIAGVESPACPSASSGFGVGHPAGSRIPRSENPDLDHPPLLACQIPDSKRADWLHSVILW
jgi:hypothetical protein